MPRSAWRVHTIAADFTRIDSWDVPLALTDTDRFVDVYHFLMSLDPVDSSLLTKWLFQLRYKVGGYFGWDDENAWPPIPETGESSLTERLSAADQAKNLNPQELVISHKAGRLRTVYLFDTEALLEISNATIYALLHFGLEDDRRITLSVYTKSRGRMSDVYMRLIRPFRHWIVYPTLMKFFAKRWALRTTQSAESAVAPPR